MTRPATARAAFLALALAATACSGGTHHAAAPPTSTTTIPLPTTGCPAATVPAGFALDRSHSGSIQPADYSPSGDMQAAMIYDHYQGGYRTVYTDLQPATNPELVVECVALQFADASGATRFVAAFQALRGQAGNLATAQTPAAKIGTTTLQYLETGQGFSGYGITSTTVAEVAAVAGNRFYVASVAGPGAAPTLPTALVQAMVAA